MPRFAANLSFLYTEHPFLERFAAAAADGFAGVEFLFPYAWAPEALAAPLQAAGLQQVLFNAPPAGSDAASMASAWDRGERGTACLPGREAEFQAGITTALRYAAVLQCPRIHVMAGLVPQAADRAVLHATYVRNLRWAAEQAQQQGCTLLIEPINPRDMPGYFLVHQAQAHAVVAEVGSPHLQVQMDLYHCQVTEGDVASKLRQYLPTGAVGHIQIAGVPERQEPSQGELHYPYLLALVDELGFDGWVGCEYRPRLGAQPGGTQAGLGWRDTPLR
ncbi:2-oxo-tetronate isomerase [Rhodoferax saidenbachensis]|uniref:Hydroxypyruvate isomerase n=1 Tax=Rhodoferax saidenbachensis TaxID=1484693 RepID=A0ABU1ZP83_9BURK|nr:2-oxo-tetronate isomerase [Rhodoferax saidenbachensis]MDR7307359.1 hydroxypyruvate isomerase [Rhodoferax saidenbachensis]